MAPREPAGRDAPRRRAAAPPPGPRAVRRDPVFLAGFGLVAIAIAAAYPAWITRPRGTISWLLVALGTSLGVGLAVCISRARGGDRAWLRDQFLSPPDAEEVPVSTSIPERPAAAVFLGLCILGLLWIALGHGSPPFSPHPPAGDVEAPIDPERLAGALWLAFGAVGAALVFSIGLSSGLVSGPIPGFLCFAGVLALAFGLEAVYFRVTGIPRRNPAWQGDLETVARVVSYAALYVITLRRKGRPPGTPAPASPSATTPPP